MKILVIADYLNQNHNLKKIIEEETPSIIITLGDLSEYQLQELKDVNIPKIGVYGNHCKGNYLEELNFKNMHGKTQKINNINFAGIEGCPKYKNSKYHLTEDDCSQALKNFTDVDVLISHAPPQGINDDIADNTHSGYKSLRNWIDENSPKLILHGHSYPPKDQEISIHNKTIVIYVHGCKIIDLNKLPKPTKKSSSYSSLISPEESFW